MILLSTIQNKWLRFSITIFTLLLQLATLIYLPTTYTTCPAKQYPDQIDRSDVYEALINLDTTKAVGCDRIHSSILKTCAATLLEPIYHLFSICLRTSSVPLEWKLHKIIPIPKKGDLLSVSNYRHISPYSVFYLKYSNPSFTRRS